MQYRAYGGHAIYYTNHAIKSSLTKLKESLVDIFDICRKQNQIQSNKPENLLKKYNEVLIS
jgi:hypothetical protein